MNFIETSKIKVTTAVVAAVFVLGLVIGQVTWQVNVSRDLHEIRQAQAELTWRRIDMESWVSRTERINYLTSWRGAEVARER